MSLEVKRILIGRPLPTHEATHERLTNIKALAVFSSDALSSVAYATQEILIALSVVGSAYFHLSLPIALTIVLLLGILTLSYRQTISSYPTGGGAYIVARDNLGTWAGLTAGAALLIDYVLTVAVSTAAGVAAVTSAFPALHEHRVLLGLLAIAAVTLINLRGVRESGTLFAVPTYAFMATIALLVVTGLFRRLVLHDTPAVVPMVAGRESLTLFLILKAFSHGCTALTGVEAISNGVQAFRQPEPVNARKTMVAMSLMLGAMFLGITYLANAYGVAPADQETVLSQIGRHVFGQSWFYYGLQAATALILVLAANTAYADFPRLASLIARDGFLPRQLASLGDRLVFSNGIVTLGVLAGLLIVEKQGETEALIPLYAVGVFLSFTLSQAGMVLHWWRDRGRDHHWFVHAAVNGMGALATLTVLLIFAITKFVEGAWVVIILIPCVMALFQAVHSHYLAIADQLRLRLPATVRPVRHTVVIPVAGVNQAVAQTIAYARSITSDVTAVYVCTDPEQGKQLAAKWEEWNPGVPLVRLQSPFRSVLQPLLNYIDRLERQHQEDFVTVLIPEFIPRKWWHRVLHNQTAMALKFLLLFRPRTVITSVPFHLRR